MECEPDSDFPSCFDNWENMNITGIIHAAGTSSRMGEIHKLLLKYNRHTIIEEVLEHLSNYQIDIIVFITGFENSRIEGLLASYLTFPYSL